LSHDAEQPNSPRIINRKARHDYHILDTLEVGIALQGSEVKSIRNGQVSLAEGYAHVEPTGLTLSLYDVDIAPYAQAQGPAGHEPKRVRRLLAHRREIARLLTQTAAKGATLIPLTLYFKRGIVKLELGVAAGKKHYDKRQDIKAREAQREMKRGMTRKRI
jgi:SsrA-binding protein